MVGEGLRDNIRVIAEGQVALQQRFDAFETDLKGELARLDRPVTRLEAKRRSRPS